MVRSYLTLEGLRVIWKAISSPVGRYVTVALVVLSAYAVWAHRKTQHITTEVKTEIVQQDQKVIKKKVEKAHNAEGILRNRLTTRPSSLRDDNDGYRRD